MKNELLFPESIFLDTNIIQSAGIEFKKQWFVEFKSLIDKHDLLVIMCETVFFEAKSFFYSDCITKKHQRLLDSISFFNTFFPDFCNIDLNEIAEINEDAFSNVYRQNLNGFGIKIIPDTLPDIKQTLREALDKIPPFESDGKGFCDTIILESYIAYSKQNHFKSVLLASNDKAIQNSEERFRNWGIAVKVVKENELIEELELRLNRRNDLKIKQKESILSEFINIYQDKLFKYINDSTIQFREDWLQGINLLDIRHQPSYTIDNVLSVEPKTIVKIIFGTYSNYELVEDSRYPIKIIVELCLLVDMHIFPSSYSIFQTRNSLKIKEVNMDNPLEKQVSFPLEIEKSRNHITRRIAVDATVDRSKYENMKPDDLRFGKISLQY